MQRIRANARCRAFTAMELIIVLAVILVVAGLLLPASTGHRNLARIMRCQNNLKQLALAEELWAGDHGGSPARRVSTNAGGSLEFLEAGQVNLHQQVLSSYLLSTEPLCCPSDNRTPTNYASLQNTNLSYFASLDARPTNLNWFVHGDRNLADGGKAMPGLLALTARTPAAWTRELHGREFSARRGVVSFPDGRVEVLMQPVVASTLGRLGPATNRLAFP